jgi:calcium channel MID1
MHPVFMNDQKLDNTIPYLILDDTDRNNALFLSSPYGTTAPNSSLIIASGLPVELSYSMCAAKLKQLTNYNVNTTITQRGPNNLSRQQFMVSNLTQNTLYTAYMTLPYKNGIVGITTPIFLSTKVDANCRIIYDLDFCNQVAYSVPANPGTFLTDDMHSLAQQYDSQALEKFGPFNTSLSQYNCDSTQYSLVRNCTDCHRDYKTWLCAVTIPRCTDSSSRAYLSQGTDDVQTAPAIRDISVNASRNPWVDETLRPGEWTELLPCIDLCYHVVQSCPPFLQFYCPEGDLAIKQYGYWQNGTASANGTLIHFDVNNPTCNRMGVDATLLSISAASRHSYTFNSLFIISMALSFIFSFL